ncbi:MAG: type I-C CRISPR-associated protein Cas5c [Thermomicrobiales bacterium]|nr:type I-C CRISPR-associated protein Cas5c [Thermomicrobiales bacterium]
MEFDRPVEVKVWGDYGCFTRPEMKAERVTYPVITPSAARGVLEAIYWKPEFFWSIREIVILNPITYFSILRNEVNVRASERVARGWEATGGGLDASDSDVRNQRNTLALRNVAYIIRADIIPKSADRGVEAKHRDVFRRRVVRGKCFMQPYLGTREFTAWFGAPGPEDVPQDLSMKLGRMLQEMAYLPGRSGAAKPIFFDAELKQGVLHVPPIPETSV